MPVTWAFDVQQEQVVGTSLVLAFEWWIQRWASAASAVRGSIIEVLHSLP
jgi:hypothetical protein